MPTAPQIRVHKDMRIIIEETRVQMGLRDNVEASRVLARTLQEHRPKIIGLKQTRKKKWVVFENFEQPNFRI